MASKPAKPKALSRLHHWFIAPVFLFLAAGALILVNGDHGLIRVGGGRLMFSYSALLVVAGWICFGALFAAQYSLKRRVAAAGYGVCPDCLYPIDEQHCCCPECGEQVTLDMARERWSGWP